jgi:hypothetical protein
MTKIDMDQYCDYADFALSILGDSLESAYECLDGDYGELTVQSIDYGECVCIHIRELEDTGEELHRPGCCAFASISEYPDLEERIPDALENAGFTLVGKNEIALKFQGPDGKACIEVNLSSADNDDEEEEEY